MTAIELPMPTIRIIINDLMAVIIRYVHEKKSTNIFVSNIVHTLLQ